MTAREALTAPHAARLTAKTSETVTVLKRIVVLGRIVRLRLAIVFQVLVAISLIHQRKRNLDEAGELLALEAGK